MRVFLLISLLACSCGDVTSAPVDANPSTDANVGLPGMVTFTNHDITGAVTNTEFVAFQDGGDGEWQAVAGIAGVYTFPVKGPRYAVATACSVQVGTTLTQVYYSTLSDGTALVGQDLCTGDAQPTVIVSGTLAGQPAGSTVQVSTGAGTTTTVGANWSTRAVAGAGTLLAAVKEGTRPTSMVLAPVTYAADDTYALNFADEFTAAEAPLIADPTATSTFQTVYYDERGGAHGLDEPDLSTGSYRALPASRVGAGISTLRAVSSDAQTSRSLERAFKTPVAQTMTLPAVFALAAAPQVVAMTPYPIVEASLPLRSGAAYYQLAYASTESRSLRHSWQLSVTAAWAGSVPGAELKLRLPDLSALPGWKPAFALTAGAEWEASAFAAPARFIPGAARAPRLLDGEEVSSASASGTVR